MSSMDIGRFAEFDENIQNEARKLIEIGMKFGRSGNGGMAVKECHKPLMILLADQLGETPNYRHTREVLEIMQANIDNERRESSGAIC